MTNMRPQNYLMTGDERKYIFLHQDGYITIKVEGTAADIAYRLFQNFLEARQDGYGGIYPDPVGPFYLDVAEKQVILEWACTIRPEPSTEFWTELSAQVQRFMNLKAFS